MSNKNELPKSIRGILGSATESAEVIGHAKEGMNSLLRKLKEDIGKNEFDNIVPVGVSIETYINNFIISVDQSNLKNYPHPLIFDNDFEQFINTNNYQLLKTKLGSNFLMFLGLARTVVTHEHQNPDHPFGI
jgi:hypothetical protein